MLEHWGEICIKCSQLLVLSAEPSAVIILILVHFYFSIDQVFLSDLVILLFWYRTTHRRSESDETSQMHKITQRKSRFFD